MSNIIIKASYDIHSIKINLRINPGRNKEQFPKAGKIESIEVRKGIFIVAIRYYQSLKDAAWEADAQAVLNKKKA